MFHEFAFILEMETKPAKEKVDAELERVPRSFTLAAFVPW